MKTKINNMRLTITLGFKLAMVIVLIYANQKISAQQKFTIQLTNGGYQQVPIEGLKLTFDNNGSFSFWQNGLKQDMNFTSVGLIYFTDLSIPHTPPPAPTLSRIDSLDTKVDNYITVIANPDPDGDAITKYGMGVPDVGFSIESATNTLLLPANTLQGHRTYNYTAKEFDNQIWSVNATGTITTKNNIPQVSITSPGSNIVYTNGKFEVKTLPEGLTDIDGDTLYKKVSLPLINKVVNVLNDVPVFIDSTGLLGNRACDIFVELTDKADTTKAQVTSITPNTPPSDPIVIYPLSTDKPDSRQDINFIYKSTDRDGDPLVYNVDFVGPEFNKRYDNQKDTLNLPALTLKENTTYTFTVKSNDGKSDSNPVSETVTTPNDAPGNFNISKPVAKDTLDVTIDNELRWKRPIDTDPLKYDVDITDSLSFNKSYNDLTDTSFTIPQGTLPWDSKLYIRITAKDGQAQTNSDVIPVYTPKKPNTPPNSPSNLRPNVLDTVDTKVITHLSWDVPLDPNGDAIKKYRIIMPTIGKIDSTDINSYDVPANTFKGHTINGFTVEASDGKSWSDKASSVINTRNNDPDPFTIITQSGDIDRAKDYALEWHSAKDRDADTLTYDVILDAEIGQDLKYTIKNDTTYTVPKNTLADKTRYTLRINAKDGHGGTRLSDNSVTLDVITGIGDNALADRIKIWPNPTTGIINIGYDFNKTVNAFRNLYSVDGNLLYNNEGSLNGKQEEFIDLSTFKNGMYLMQLTIDGYTEWIKIIKK